MFRKNPLVEIELDYLRQNRPHQKQHYFLLALALLVATAPLFYMFIRQDGALVQAMAFVILSVYWFVQWLIMKAAVVSANHELPDELLGSYSNRQIISAKLWAVLRHYRGFILLISLATLGLSLALMGYLHRIPWEHLGHVLDERGILKYMGIIGHYTLPLRTWEVSPIVPHPLQLTFALFILLLFSLANSVMSISAGLLVKRNGHLFLLRIMVVSVVFGLFCGLFTYRDSSYDELGILPCDSWRYENSPDACNRSEVQLFNIRLLESLQASTISFLDNGTSLITVFLCPIPVVEIDYYTESNEPRYRMVESVFGSIPRLSLISPMIRNVLAAIVTIFSQLSLSAFLLWRTSRGMGKKKK